MPYSALIDCGTNVFKLLVINTDSKAFTPVMEKNYGVQLGKGGLSSGLLNARAFDTATSTLLQIKNDLEQYHIKPEEVLCLATSAVRLAANRQNFIKSLKDKTGFLLESIPGNLEAEYIYDGVKVSGALDHQPSLIVDLGGGSVEFIFCNQENVLWSKSVECGAQRMMDIGGETDQLTAIQKQKTRDFLEFMLDDIIEETEGIKHLKLIGTAGTFDTIRSMAMPEDDKTEPSKEIPKDAYLKAINSLVASTKDQRQSIPNMIEARMGMIPYAAYFLQLLEEKLDIAYTWHSAYSLKEGAVLKRFLSKDGNNTQAV